MTTDPIHRHSALPARTRSRGQSNGKVLLDHASRLWQSRAGFRVHGKSWLRPWAAYCVSPITYRASGERIALFDGFSARTNECDLYTFANVFADYPLIELRRALGDVNLIVDLGANVGAFSFLVRTLASQARIVAVEPDKKNVAFLRAQPFARTIEIREAAVGPFDGKARLIAGENSVTHHVDLSGSAEGEVVSLISLDSLCQEPALVKMDIEGGELSILENGLPENIRHLMLEWHYGGVPSDLVAGNWKHISTDLHGATMWYWRR